MAINGYFKPSHQEPAPYVSGSVYLPRLGVGDRVDFLLDTGADATTLHPRDAGKLGVYAHSLGSASVSAKGIGGPMQYTPEYALVSFFDREAGDWRNFRIQVYIASPENEYDSRRAAVAARTRRPQSLPPHARCRREQRHPGTSLRLAFRLNRNM